MPKKTERRNPLGFSNIHSVAKHQKKCRGDPLRKKNFEKKIRKKCLAVPKKNERGDSLVSPGMICYAEKQVNSFWSSSLGQMVLFDTIIFCRTFKNYFGQFVWIEKKKKRVTIIVAFHFMKRRLKTPFDSKIISNLDRINNRHPTTIQKLIAVTKEWDRIDAQFIKKRIESVIMAGGH